MMTKDGKEKERLSISAEKYSIENRYDISTEKLLDEIREKIQAILKNKSF